MSEDLLYPLGEKHADRLRARSGRPLADLTLENVRAGTLDSEDFAISAATLRHQARLAEGHGYRSQARNLRRAAELVEVPNQELLAIYDALRPGRSSAQELSALAERLETVYRAEETADLIREAAQVYQEAGLTRGASD